MIATDVRSSRRAYAVLLACTMGLTGPAHAGAKADDASALRRACATGALTAYACAQRGVHSAGAPLAPAPAGQAAAARAADASPTVAVAPPNGRPPPHAIRPFQDTRKRYALELPEGWELRMQGGSVALAHGADWMQLRSAPAADAGRGAAAGLEMLRGEYSQLRTLTDAPVQVGGRVGRRLTLSARSRGGRPSTLIVVSAPMTSGEMFVLLAGGAPDAAAALDAGASALVRTLRFR